MAAVRCFIMVVVTLVLCNASPPVTNSLVNLGKLDISFYIDTKSQGMKSSSFLKQRLPRVTSDSCACMGPTRDPIPDIMTKLLRNNDLFSFNKPISPLCCDSHEQVREDSIILEMGPQQRIGSGANLPPSALLDALMPSLLPQDQRHRNPIEFVIFPNRKEVNSPEINKLPKGIKAVGDRELRNDFKTLKPPSVKKDLNIQGNEENRNTKPNTNLV